MVTGVSCIAGLSSGRGPGVQSSGAGHHIQDRARRCVPGMNWDEKIWVRVSETKVRTCLSWGLGQVAEAYCPPCFPSIIIPFRSSERTW